MAKKSTSIKELEAFAKTNKEKKAHVVFIKINDYFNFFSSTTVYNKKI
jgi:hypothetical protein